MTSTFALERLRMLGDARRSALRYLGIVRITLILVVAIGANLLLQGSDRHLLAFLLPFYAFGILSGVWYLTSLRWIPSAAKPLFTWVQVLVDFGVVAATVSFTGGLTSAFTFLFVVVILEAGLLLGPGQGFFYATIAAAFMVVQMRVTPDPHSPLGRLGPDVLALMRSYHFLIQVLAYYLTASISGYWNQRVRRMQRFQREILDNMNNGFLLADRDGRITAINRAASHLLGFAEGDGAGRNVRELLRVAGGGESPLATSLRTGRDYTRYEFQSELSPGRLVLVGLSTSCMRGPSGETTGLIASFSDLTELARMRDELQRQDRLAAVGELSAGLAHEIRNPVAAIRGAVEELRRSMENPALVQRLAGIAMRECDQLNSIITAFLDFAREPRIGRDPVDVWALVHEVADELTRGMGGESKLHVRVSRETDASRVSADRDQIKQVLLNIGWNAVEAMKGDGTLSIVMARAASALLIRFDDEGPGIAPDEVARIFEPFYTTKPAGVGMGLAVSMRIVTAHNGTMQVTSREEGGASVTVRLPLAPDDQHPQKD